MSRPPYCFLLYGGLRQCLTVGVNCTYECSMCDISMVTGIQIRCVFSFLFCVISSPNPMSDHLLESSHRDDSNKWSNIGFGEEMTQVVSIGS